MVQAPPEPARRRRRRLIGWTALGLLVVIVAAGAWVATRVLVVRDELAAIGALQHRAQSALAAGEVEELGRVVADFEQHAAAAAGAAGDPLWRVAEVVPFAGANLGAARLVSEQLDVVASQIAGPLVAVTEDVGRGGLLNDGAIDIAMIAGAREPLAHAVVVLDEANVAIAAVPRDHLIAPLADGVADVQQVLEMLSGTVGGIADLSRVLPEMLGSDEPRSLLVMMQNNAELRSGGGITGSFAEIVADQGALTLARQADSSEFRRTKTPILPVPESTTALYGDIVGRYVQNTTTTPDFDLSARLASTWWEGLTGDAPDLVLAIDPLVLRALLAVTGPITLADGTELTHDGFVRQVLVAPYMHLEPKEQTVFFQDLTERFFSALTSSDAAPGVWAEALRTPIERGRISVWSAREDEAAVLAGTAMAGSLGRHQAAGDDAFMVYFNDVTGSKMDSSLTIGLAAVTGSCRADDRPEVAVRVRLTNDAPEDAGTAWPFSMTGSGRWGTTAGHIATAVAVAAPSGWFFGGTTIDGERQPSVDVEDGGFPTSAAEVTLAPGESALIEVRFVAPADGEIVPQLLYTPLLRAPEELAGSPMSCG